jgi:hypothetical protein
MTIPSLFVPDKVSWDEFRTNHLDWKQGEHVAAIGPTGSGKSVLLRALSWERDWCAWFVTKKKDKTFDEALAMGWVRSTKWPPPKPPRDQRFQRILLWPEYKRILDIYKAAPLFKQTLDYMFIDEGWSVILDDLFFLTVKLKLEQEITAINYQVRSMGLTLMSAMQRPKKVPLESWDQASHAFLGRIGNYDDLQQIRGLAQVDTKTLQGWLKLLAQHEWLYLPVANAFDRVPVIVKPPLNKPKKVR